MGIVISNGVKKVWDTWNLRGFILLSLSLQTFLILSAPLRKRTSNKLIIVFIWSAYLLADWAANFAVGLIASSQFELCKSEEDDGGLTAFWAPFLLLHLGGPDTITAFALEDNELWLRHLFGLIFQAIAAVYVFVLSLSDNHLWVPTLLVFLAGIIKYAERTLALHLASVEGFRASALQEPDPGPNYARLMDEYKSKQDAGLPVQFEIIPESDKIFTAENQGDGSLNALGVVRSAYKFFEMFKGLIVDLIFTFHDRDESRRFFLEKSPENAFEVVEVELNFIYGALYTKATVVHCKIGYFLRFFCFGFIVASLAIIWAKEKHAFQPFDVAITYALLLGAIALDIVSLLMSIFSDRTAADLKESKRKFTLTNMIRYLNNCIVMKRSTWLKNARKSKTIFGRIQHILFRRWSEKIPTYNLIDYCLKDRPERPSKMTKYFCLKHFISAVIMVSKVCHYLGFGNYVHVMGKIISKVFIHLGIRDLVDYFFYVSSEPFTEHLRTFIFEELKRKSKAAREPGIGKEICSARGNWVLKERSCNESLVPWIDSLIPWIQNVEYDESLLLWHIATELCFADEGFYERKSNTEEGQGSDNNKSMYPGFCKLMSDYMLYLLAMQPAMMSAVAGIGRIRFRDTCAEAKQFFTRQEIGLGPETGLEHLKKACESILKVNTERKPVEVKGERSKSVLFDACILAKKLRERGEEKWEIMSKVWVELLSYAASHCSANAHAQQLSKGGELVTIVWLLMTHLGLGEQFQIKGLGKTKLIVGK